ncbi:MAG: PQQ-binding-like beta-propeller repeat protein, partial [Bdellovibrionales bacterium]|nr:PQQ-binding-like beta-propeller repeat protein [Oligoflexia bacterium]
VVTPKHVIFASSSEYLYALERATGKLVYRYQIGHGSGFSGGLAFDPVKNWLYALSRGGNLLSFTYQP